VADDATTGDAVEVVAGEAAAIKAVTGEASASRKPALALRGVWKQFGTVTANASIDLEVYPGEVHVVLGENGAGKSTLMNIAFGHLQPDKGRVEINGRTTRLMSPADAIAQGVGMVHQHFTLVAAFTVAENIVLGSRSARAGRLDRRAVVEEVTELSERFRVPVDPSALVRDLPVDERQRVEILKALHRNARILILDEPTALLGSHQIAVLLEIIDRLRRDGHAIVLVTHKLGEVMEIADRVSVIRRGRKRVTLSRGEFDEQTLTKAMTGRLITDDASRSDDDIAERDERGLVLDCGDFTVSEPLSGPPVSSLSLRVRSGEVLGIAGVEGNGQRAVIDGLTGSARCDSAIRLDGKELNEVTPRLLRLGGVSIIPEDRQAAGLIGDMTLAENLALVDLLAAPDGASLFVSWKRLRNRAKELLKAFDVRPPDPDLPASALSGGNQQKVVLARELSRQPKLLVADNPTWGLDVGAVAFVHRQIIAARNEGSAIVLVSHDLDELMKLSDRIIVVYRGEKTLETSRADADLDSIGLAMAGAL